MIDSNDGLGREYLADCCEHMDTIEAALLSIGKGENLDTELAERAFRAVHSVKGGAGYFELSKIHELTDKMEELLAPVRSGGATLTPDRVDVLLSAKDRLQDLIRDPDASNEADIVEVLAALTRAGAGHPESPDKSNASTVGSTFGRAVDSRTDPRGRRLRVLLVEDDFASRLLLQTFLSRYGECHVAVNGREAVEAFRSGSERGERYDLVCMDIMMPEMDGREAVRQVRALEEAEGIFSTTGAKIIMTTAVEDVKEVIKCFRELCDAYLMKPIDLAQLLSHMKSCQLVS